MFYIESVLIPPVVESLNGSPYVLFIAHALTKINDVIGLTSKVMFYGENLSRLSGFEIYTFISNFIATLALSLTAFKRTLLFG